MIYESEEMRDARHELQILSAMDPLARANMLHHVDAYTRLLMGRPGPEAADREPLLAGGFTLEDGEDRLLARLVRTDGVDRLYLIFDVDDAQGSPIELNLFRFEDGNVFRYRNCMLWSPPREGRALLVPTGDQQGYFTFQRDQPFRWHAGTVPSDWDAGVRRAEHRIAKLLGAAAAMKVHHKGFSSVIRNQGQTLHVKPLPLDA